MVLQLIHANVVYIVYFLFLEVLILRRQNTKLVLKTWCHMHPFFPQVLLDVHFSSVAQSCLTLCDPMNCSTPGLPIYHQFLESTQTHVHWVCDAIQPSHPLSSPAPPALNLSQHQGFFQMSQLFTLGGQSIGASASTAVLPINTQDWSPLGWTGWISLQSKELSRVFSNTTVQKHQFLGAIFFMVQLSHPYMNTEKTIALARWTLLAKWCLWH